MRTTDVSDTLFRSGPGNEGATRQPVARGERRLADCQGV